MTRKYLPALTLALLFSLVAALVVVAGVPEGTSGRPGSTSLLKPSIFELRAFIPNRVRTDVINRGQFVSWFRTGDAGMEWPAGSGNTINFASGLWLIGQVNGDLRSAAAEYSVEYTPGTVVNGVPQDPNLDRFRIYIITRSDREAALDNDPNTVPGEDYLNWPVQDGAPVDADGNPLILGDAALWSVFNDFDEAAHANLWSTKPLGVEVQMYLWGFNRTDGFGDMIFMKFTIINKGGNTIDSTYASFWDDADVGDAGDDFVGVDTTLSLGYTWNDGADAVYGPRAPALGYDFFQGPIVPSPGDTAIFNFKKVPDWKNLQISAFAKYINGGGNDWGDPEDAVQALNYMKGLNRAGEPYVDPTTGQITKFVHPGDPVTGEGWIDPMTHSSGDRRFLMTTGPFTMAPGDTQEVVGGMICAQGSNNLQSIVKLRQLDQAAQAAYDRNFALPPTPPTPKVTVRELDGRIVLEWDDSAEAYDVPDLIGRQKFQGYNVYQVSGPQVSPNTPATLIATYDVVDNIFEPVRDVVFTDEGAVNKVVQPITNNGIQRFFSTDVDETRGRSPLINGRKYWFAVTAFAVNPDGNSEIGVPKVLESPMKILEVTPQSPPLGTRYTATFMDTLAVTRLSGRSDGSVIPIVIDPSSTTGHTYQVTFTEGQEITWNLVDVTANKTVLSDQTNQSGDNEYPIADGLMVKVLGPPLAAKDWDYTPGTGTGDRWFSGVNGGGDIFFGGVFLGPNFTGSSLAPGDFKKVEIRWGAILEGTVQPGEPYTVDTSHPNSSKAFMYFTWGPGNYEGFFDIPFSAWDVDSDPPRQLAVIVRDRDGNGLWNVHYQAEGIDHRWNYIWVMDDDYDPTGTIYDPNKGGRDFMENGADHSSFPVQYVLWLRQRGSRALFQDPGAVFTLEPNRVNTSADVFEVSAPAVVQSTDLARQDVEKINVFPNPYYARNVEETDPLRRFVTFTHLPETATIRIFTLAGDLVKRIDHQGGQFQQWDLRNDSGIPIASGIYIVHIDLGAQLGQRVLKMAVFMPEERLDVL